MDAEGARPAQEAKTIHSVTTAANTQIAQFLTQCRDFAEQAATSAAHSVASRLADLSAVSDLVCGEWNRDVVAAETAGTELSALCRELNHEVSVHTNALAGLQFATSCAPSCWA